MGSVCGQLTGSSCCRQAAGQLCEWDGWDSSSEPVHKLSADQGHSLVRKWRKKGRVEVGGESGRRGSRECSRGRRGTRRAVWRSCPGLW